MSTTDKRKVAVLMSTYNGERYLREQIDSILQQQDITVSLIVRDDGSNDGTINILQEYNKGAHRLDYYQGENAGPARSFMELLVKAPEADFYAFSDQDDYWLPNKLSAALDAIGNIATPALYYCQTQLADKNLQPFPSVKINPYGTFGEALVYQFIGGCTMVMNAALRAVINEYTPKYLAMHDVWIYDIAKAIDAAVVFDPTPHILYRQHDQNVIGQGYSRWKEWRRRIQRIVFGKEHMRYRTALEVQRGYEKRMTPQNKDILQLFLLAKKSPLKRCRLVWDKRFRCQPANTYRNFQLAVILNTY